jgi:hemolysin D
MLKRLKRLITHDTLDYEFLPSALEIEATPPSPLRRAVVWIIFAITVGAIAWSCLGRVDEVAVARGKVIPDGRVKVIQPIEAGVIREIHVQEGERVREGQLLIELDPTIKGAESESATRMLAIHQAERTRLERELRGRDSAGASPVQRELKEAREAEYAAREESLRLVITQRDNALRAAEAILTKMERTYPLVKEQEGSYRTLFNQGVMARNDLLEKQKEYHAAEQELEAQRRIVQQARESLEEARRNLEALRRERQRTILSDIVERDKSISSLEGEVIKARKMVEMERLVSPVAGTVHGLAAYTIGGVVTPAQPVVTIVPDGTPLVVEAMALNKDIGFLKVGQEAEVKLDTFPFQKYGTVKGKVLAISPDAFDDEKLGPVYRIKVALERTSLAVNGRQTPVSPGMTAAVEVKTGKRRIIEFFLSPVIKYANESLTIR